LPSPLDRHRLVRELFGEACALLPDRREACLAQHPAAHAEEVEGNSPLDTPLALVDRSLGELAEAEARAGAAGRPPPADFALLDYRELPPLRR